MLISKIFETETAHIVRDAVSKRCAYTPHGHSYIWKVFIYNKHCQDNGMVLDFKELKFAKDYIDLFDHSMVFWEKEKKEILDFFKNNFDRILIMKKNSTAENMARLINKYISEYFKNEEGIDCFKVEVNETRTGCGISEYQEYDDNDVLVYQHENLY
jgi:6-pyruvoyltetrahydropterin/6-carboxytetrahydropterin synthase